MMNYANLVETASPDMVVEGMRIIGRNYLPNNYFLPDSNPLKVDSGYALKQHFNGRSSLALSDVQTYVATSCLVHCFDGWLYLSHAIDSLLKGDRGIAIHLSYYAELRACMSFLARQGISVNASNHIALSQNGIIKCSKTDGTHTAAWELLNKWITSPTVDKTPLLRYFEVRNHSFYDWINYVPYHITPIVASRFSLDWLTEWSFDVSSYKQDKYSRNLVSYRPQRLIDTSQIDLISKVSGVINLWKFIEPHGTERFALLDKYLFKLLFEKITNYLLPTTPNITLNGLIEATFTRSGLTPDPVISAIIRSGNLHQILQSAKDLTIEESSGKLTPLTIISRALLMLRIASGGALNLLKNANINKDSIDFYLNPLGLDNGHWKGATPDNFVSLWEEIGDSIISLQDLLDDSEDLLLHDLYSGYSKELNSFKQISRACFWGTCA